MFVDLYTNKICSCEEHVQETIYRCQQYWHKDDDKDYDVFINFFGKLLTYESVLSSITCMSSVDIHIMELKIYMYVGMIVFPQLL